MKNLVVGCGISGCVIADLLAAKSGEEVVIIDRKNHIAGNIYDYKDKETSITVHKYGPHIFHTKDKKVWDYLSEFTPWHYFFLKPNAMVEGKPVTLPFNLTTLGEVFSPYMAQKFEEKLINEFGYGAKIPILELKNKKDKDLQFLAKYIYENIFVNYTTKQWGLTPEEIDPTVSARVPVLISHDNRYFQDKYQGIPKFGYTKMIEKMLDNKNIKVKLNTDFKDFDLKGFNRIFYSGAIDEYFEYKYGQLPYRSLEFDIRSEECEYYQKTVVVNYPNNYDFTRICEHKHFLNEKSSKTVISIEYPVSFKVGVNERYYPISNKENEHLYLKYLTESQKIKNLYFLGRLGDYKYYNMDAAVVRAMELYEAL